MQQDRFRLLAAFVISIGLITTSVQAQSPAGALVEIPFSFTAGTTIFPAGQYSIKPHGQNLIAIQSYNTHTKVTVLARNIYQSTPGERGRLRFTRYGHQYFLSQVWTSGDTVGRQLYTSDVERELAKSKSGHQPATHLVRLP